MLTKRSIVLIAIILFVVCIIYLTRYTSFGDYFTLEHIKTQQKALELLYQSNKVGFIAAYMAIYITTTAISLPGAALLTLLAGAIFGLVTGTIIVSFASSIGATCAFLIARWLFHDYFKIRFANTLAKINKGIEKEGAFYLFALRLIAIFPFFLINILMGLTTMKVWTFYIVSQLGMLAGTIAYVNAGKELSKIENLSSILSPSLLIAFAILGLLPLISKWIIKIMKPNKNLRKFPKPKKFDYNIVVIGAGSGGLVASYIGALLKAKVALIEKSEMGGDCLNTGCVPSKALIRVAKIFSDAKRAKEFGIDKITTEFDFAKIMEHIQDVIRKVAPHDSVERYQSLGVDCYSGEAKVLSPYLVEVNKQVISTKNIILATGGSPIIPDIEGIHEVNPLTTNTIWSIRKQPQHLVIVGGGPVSCELAQCFCRIGSKVTIIQHRAKLLKKEDDDVASFIAKTLQDEGINILINTEPNRFFIDNEKKKIEVIENGISKNLEFDELLVATGRRPNLQGFGLEDIGVEFSNTSSNASKSKVELSETLQTNYPNIFVCGDAAGSYQFTHYASHQAWYASVNALFRPFWQFKVDNSIIPWCTFTDPEIAHVGLNEKQAKELNIPYELTSYQIDELDRAVADVENHGFIKVLTVPNKDKILGVTIVSSHASDIILEFIQAMKYNIGLDKILKTIHIYPTLGEANKYLAGNWKKKHVPERALAFLKTINFCRRG